ncbi:P27 family phage terminase small subunit, partial [Wenyingzhuangia sp. 1_MG-2023]|nr:P27 family phage terminase small subunit [Wenyingzhuangia sp. 1_MG-2023]
MAERPANVIPLETKKIAASAPSGPQQGDQTDVFQGIVPGLPEKPENLTPEQSDFWDEIGQKLVDSGIISEVDLSAFHRYVVSYCQWRQWNDLCQENFGLGSIQVYSTGAKSLSVQAVLRKQAADELRKLEHQFGLT